MDFILGLFTGYLLNWTALSVLFVLAIFCEAVDATKTALFFATIMAITGIVFFQVPLQTMGYYTMGYLLFGVLWSIWRYKRHVTKTLASVTSFSGRERLIEQLHPARMTGQIVHWMVIWPISFISNATGDLIVLAKSIVTHWLKGIYEGIYNSAVSSVRNKDPQ